MDGSAPAARAVILDGVNGPAARRRFVSKARPAAVSRRSWLSGAGATALAVAAMGAVPAPVPPDFRIRKGRIRQSIMGWTLDPMPVSELARLCKSIRLVAMEGIDARHYPMIRELGLEVSFCRVLQYPPIPPLVKGGEVYPPQAGGI